MSRLERTESAKAKLVRAVGEPLWLAGASKSVRRKSEIRAGSSCAKWLSPQVNRNYVDDSEKTEITPNQSTQIRLMTSLVGLRERLAHRALGCEKRGMATDDPEDQRDDVGDRVIDDVRKTARHLESQLHEVKGRISRKVMDDLRHGLSQLRLLGPAGRRGVPDDQPMHHLTAAELGFELHLGDQMVNKLRQDGYLYGYLPDGRKRGRVYPAFQAWAGIYGEPLRQVLQTLGDAGGPQIDDFFADELLSLGGITPVEALLGQAFLHRGEPSSQAAEVMGLPPDKRLARIVTAARGWAQRGQAPVTPSPGTSATPTPPSVTVRIWVGIENGSKFTRGKSRAKQEVFDLIAGRYRGTKQLTENECLATIPYGDDTDLRRQIEDLIHEIHFTADLRNCIVDGPSLKNESTGDYWSDSEGRWKD